MMQENNTTTNHPTPNQINQGPQIMAPKPIQHHPYHHPGAPLPLPPHHHLHQHHHLATHVPTPPHHQLPPPLPPTNTTTTNTTNTTTTHPPPLPAHLPPPPSQYNPLSPPPPMVSQTVGYLPPPNLMSPPTTSMVGVPPPPPNPISPNLNMYGQIPIVPTNSMGYTGAINTNSSNNSNPNAISSSNNSSSNNNNQETRMKPNPPPLTNQEKAQVLQHIQFLQNKDQKQMALMELSKKRDNFNQIAPLLWDSLGTVTILLQEIIQIYPLLNPPTLSTTLSNRACNVLALLQCIATHQETRKKLLKAHIPLFLYPFLNTVNKTKPFEYLRLASLGVVGALVKGDDQDVINFLLQTEIIPLCLRIMQRGSELQRTVATFIIQRILVDTKGLNYICETNDRFLAVTSVLKAMAQNKPSSRLLKHIVRCFLRLSQYPQVKAALSKLLPRALSQKQKIQDLQGSTKSALQTLFQTLGLQFPFGPMQQQQQQQIPQHTDIYNNNITPPPSQEFNYMQQQQQQQQPQNYMRYASDTTSTIASTTHSVMSMNMNPNLSRSSSINSAYDNSIQQQQQQQQQQPLPQYFMPQQHMINPYMNFQPGQNNRNFQMYSPHMQNNNSNNQQTSISSNQMYDISSNSNNNQQQQ